MKQTQEESDEDLHSLDYKPYGLKNLDRLVRCNFFSSGNSLPK